MLLSFNFQICKKEKTYIIYAHTVVLNIKYDHVLQNA